MVFLQVICNSKYVYPIEMWSLSVYYLRPFCNWALCFRVMSLQSLEFFLIRRCLLRSLLYNCSVVKISSLGNSVQNNNTFQVNSTSGNSFPNKTTSCQLYNYTNWQPSILSANAIHIYNNYTFRGFMSLLYASSHSTTILLAYLRTCSNIYAKWTISLVLRWVIKPAPRAINHCDELMKCSINNCTAL